jgi:hypothetical protein
MFDICALGKLLIDFTPSRLNDQCIALFARNPGGAPTTGEANPHIIIKGNEGDPLAAAIHPFTPAAMSFSALSS